MSSVDVARNARKFPTKTLINITLGILAGLAIGAGAVHAGIRGFHTASSIDETGTAFQTGYVAGAYDMLSTVVAPASDLPDGFRMDYYRKKFACLRPHADTTTQLLAWQQRHWDQDRVEYASDLAASLILADACEP
jgi:hypothetical protein